MNIKNVELYMMTNFFTARKLKLVKTISFFLISFLLSNMGYAQIVYNFTNAGATGYTGPTQAQIDATYVSGNSLFGKVTSNSGVQYWTVPYSGNYKIEAYGASGGDIGGYYGGYGAKIQGEFYLTKDEVIRIVVGQKGIGVGNGAGGGGGSFVVRTPYNTNASILVIAGGGGGATSYTNGKMNGYPGLTTTSGGTTSQQGGTSSGCYGYGTGGLNGNGGLEGCAAGGGGFLSNGTVGGHQAGGGTAWNNGSTGGVSTNASGNTHGGFGSGGAGSPSNGYGGGGGGYSGGGGGGWSGSIAGNGGGGGSYNSGTNVVNTSGFNSGQGYVTITYLFAGGTIKLSDGTSESVETCTSYTPGTFGSTVSASGGQTPFAYQWQQSSNNSTWVDISGATSATYAPGVDITSTTYFRRKVTDNTTPSPNITYSNTLSIIIDAIPTTSIAGTNIVLCSGTSTTLAANTALVGTGTWSRTSGPNSPSFSNVNSNTATISGLTSGTYVLEWKISTSASGTPPACAVSTSNINLVVGAPAITSTTGGSTCNPGTATLTAAASAGTINWYSASTGGTSLGAGTSFTTSTLTSTTTFYVDATGGGCTTASRTAVVATVLANNTIALSSAAGTDAQTKCINTALTNITYSTTGATGATVTGLPTGVISAWATNVLTISGTPSVAGTFTYTINLTGGCGTITKTGIITVNQASVGTITGTAASICVGGTSTYTATSVVLAGGAGAWSSSNTAVATVNTSTGVITGVGAGTATITYTITGGCGGTITAQKLITVNALPSMTSITGVTTVCSIGSSATLSNTTAGGTWSSANTSIATIDANGLVTGVSLGTSTITYSVTDLNACTNSASTTVVISALPTTPSTLVANPATLCNAGTAILTATSTGNLINWYNTASGGTILSTVASGANYTTGTISTTTTFYAEAAYSSSQTFNYTGTLQTYTVPNGITSITIDAYGAKGGNNTAASYVGGKGARAKTTIPVTPGQVLTLLVGGKGGDYTCGAGGGGGTFVVNSSNSPLVIAGGGGGAFYCGALGGVNGGGGTATTSGGNGISTPNRSARTGGVNGNGGSSYYGGGGGGFLSAGISSATASNAGNAYPGAATTGGGSGGYGGGGAGYNACCGGAGGGGGYSGGSGGTGDGSAGGGGGSFIAGAGTNNLQTADVNNGDGYIVITSISSNPCLSPRVPIVVSMSTAANAGTITTTNETICVGATSTYTTTNAVYAGGTGAWSSSNTAVATVNASTGVITGVTAGTATITYTITGGCGGTATAQKLITIKALPVVASISGSATVCDVNGTTTLTNATTGGVWTSSNTNIATINTSGVVTGVSFGTTSITYTVTNSDGCVSANTTTISVSTLPTTPTNVTASPATICSGNTTLLNATSAGNLINWYTASSGGTLLSTVASGANYTSTSITSSKTFYAEAAYNATQTFSYTGAAQTFVVPNNVISIDVETWGAQGGSSQTGIGGKGGYAKGTLSVTPGETLNIYVGGRGTASSSAVQVNGGFNGGGYAYGYTSGAYAGSGGGASDIRKGGTALSNRVIVAGGGGGTGYYTTTIYTGGAGGGTSGLAGLPYSGYVGAGGGTQLAGGAAGTTSSYSQAGSLGMGGNNTAISGNWNGSGGGGGYYGGGSGAAVGSGGGGGSSYIGGVSSGSTIAGDASMPNPLGGANITGNTGDGVVKITFVSNPCLSPRVPIVVSLSPSASVTAVTGNATVCIGSTATYTATNIVLAGGTGVWSSTNTSVATINPTTGVITTLSAGTTNIVYTISGGCGSATAQKTVTVAALPVVASITGNAVLCDAGATSTLSNTTLGGVWSSTNTAIATIADDGTVTAIGLGNANINYTVTDINSCTNSVTTQILVSQLPATPTNVTASPATICSGNTTILNATSAGNMINWYTASSGGTSLSTVASGANYTSTSITSGKTFYAEAAYNTTQTFSYTGAVQNLIIPAGVTSIAVQSWGASGGKNTTNVASIAGMGGYASGTLSVTPGETIYIYVGSKGANSTTAADACTTCEYAGGYNGGGKGVNGGAGGGGASDIRRGGTALSNRVLVAAGAGGVGYNSGVYSGGYGGGLTGGPGAGSYTAVAGTQSTGYALGIGGPYTQNNDCGGGGGGYYGGNGGAGTNSSGAGGSSYIGGVTNGQTIAGNASMPNPLGGANITGRDGDGVVIVTMASNPCVSPRVPIVVNLAASAAVSSITGSASICVGGSATYTATAVELAGGTGVWSSANTAVATVNASTGVVTALTAGTSTITYSISGGCGTATAQMSITVNALPSLSAISGAATICKNTTTTFTNTTSGGVWTSTNASIATISNTGIVTGVASGTAIINYTYTNSNACSATVSKTITIAALPADPSAVTASPNTVLSGSTTTLSATSTGNKIAWYDVATGGTALTTINSGATYTSTVNFTTTYYAEANYTAAVSVVCISENRVPVTVTVANMSTLSTTTVTNVGLTSANTGGNISSDGGTPVIARGVCWSTSANPTIANAKTIDGTGTGSFASSITGLSNGTTYYVRAYATNAISTSYGNQYSFTTLTVPVISSFTPGTAGKNVPVTITGSNFNDVQTVQFGGTNASSFTINSNTSITALPATGASGEVSVTSPGGTATKTSFTYMDAPTLQASNIVVSALTNTQASISWTSGNGTKRAVFIAANGTGVANPSPGITYTANTIFGSGNQIGTTGWYCVYNGSGTTVNVSGLSPMTSYRIMVVEYNGLSAAELYYNNAFTGNPVNTTTLGPTITTNLTNLNDFSNCIGTPSARQVIVVAGQYLTANLLVTAPSGFEISTTDGSNYASSLTLTQTGGTVTNTNIYTRVTSLAAGTVSGTVGFSSTNAITKLVAVQGTVSELSVAGSITGNASVCIGTNSTDLSLTNNVGAIQWKQSSNNSVYTDILNATANTLTVNNLTATTYYKAYVTNGVCSTVASNAFTLTANSQPVSATLNLSNAAGAVCVGTNLSATVASAGTGGAGTINDLLQYQYDGGAWNNYTASTSLSTIGHNDVSIRSLRTVTGSGCNTASPNVYTWTVNQPPAIITHPSTSVQAVCQNGNAASLSISASGTGLTYQWYKNTSSANTGGTAITGATSATYTPSTSTAGNFYYYVIVSGSCTPSVTTNVSGLYTISGLPTITAQPSSTNQSICLNANAATISVTATGGGITYQWYENSTNNNSTGTPIAGATSSSYQPLTNVVGQKYYYVKVAGTCSPDVVSAVAGVVQSNALPTVQISQGSNLALGANGSIQLTANAVSGTPSYTYQWYKAGIEVSAAPSSGNGYNLNYNVLSLGAYTVKVTDVNGCSNLSQQTNIQALPTMSILGSNEICQGASVTFAFDASSLDPLGVEWQHSDDNVNWYSIQNGLVVNGGLAAIQKYTVVNSGYYRLAYTAAGNTTYTTASSVTVYANPVVSITPTVSLVNLCANTNLSLVGAASVGGTYTYTWSKGGTVLGNTSQLAVSNNGIYKLQMTDAHGCYGEAISDPVQFNPLPTATIIGSTAVCEAGNSPQILFSGLNASGPYTFKYNINGGVNMETSAGVNSVSVPTTDPGTYTYTLVGVRDAIGCYQAMSGSAIVTVNPLPSISLGLLDPISMAATNASLPFTNALNSPTHYAISAGTRALPNFTSVSSASLTGSSVNVIVPTSNAGVYDFNLTTINSNTGCRSTVYPFELNIVAPNVSVVGTLTALSTSYGLPSSTTRFKLSGTYVVSDLTITAPTGFEISKTINSGFAASLTVSPVNETVPNTFIYVRLKANAQVANSPYSGNIGIAATAMNTINVSIPSSTISSVPLQIGGIAIANKQYDGNTTAQITGTPYYIGLKNNEAFSVTGLPVANFANQNAGNTKSITITGYSAPSTNYYMVQPSQLTANIQKAHLLVTAVGQTVQEGTNDATVIAQATNNITGFVNNENSGVVSGTVVYTTTYTTNALVGTSGLTITPNINGLTALNYDFTSGDGSVTVVINPTSYVTVIGNNTYLYNGQSQGPVNATVIGSTGLVSYTYSGRLGTNYGPSTLPPTGVGNYQVVASLAADQIYNAATSSAYNFGITKNQLALRTRNVNVNFGSSTQTVLTNVLYDYVGLLGNDNATAVSGTVGYTTNYLSSSAVGTTGLLLSPNISQLSSANYNITAYPGTITVVDVVPTITYTNTSYTLTKNSAIRAIVPNVTGTNLNFSAASLPAGLAINAQTGIITGTPLVTNMVASTYTVTVSNSAGQSAALLYLAVMPDQPQGSMVLKDPALMSTDSVVMQFNFTQGIAPYNAIVYNTLLNTYDTIANLSSGQYVKLKPANQSTLYQLVQLSDANNTYRTNAFDNDTASLQILTPKMAILLSANTPQMLPDSSYKLQLNLKLKNNGQVSLKDLQVNADLSKFITAGYRFTIDSVVVKSGTLPVNPSYTGLGNPNVINGIITKGSDKNQYIKSMSLLLGNYLLNHNANLGIGEEALIQINLSIPKPGNVKPVSLQFSYAGLASLLLTNNQTSTQVVGALSIDAKPNAIVLDTTTMPTLISLQPRSLVGSSLYVSAATAVAQGYRFHFTGKIVNLGTSNLDSVQVVHSLKNAFGAPDTAMLVAAPTLQRGNLVYNTRFNGYGNDTLFDHSGSIAYGDSIQFEYDVVVRTNKSRATWLNNLWVKALSTLDRSFVQDSSVAGLLVDPNQDGLPYEQSFTRATVNYTAPNAPVVVNAIYQYQSAMPANIKGLVRSYPIGTIPVWCDNVTSKCDTVAPLTPTAIGRYVYEVRAYDTASLLYSVNSAMDTIIVKPVKPTVINTKYIIGLAGNPVNIQGQVTAMAGSTIKYKVGVNSLNTAPLVASFAKGNTNITVSQVVNAIESDTSILSIEMLDMKDMVHVQKIASQPKLLANSTYDIEYVFLLSNLFEKRIDNIVLTDVLKDQFPTGIEFSVQSVGTNSASLRSNPLYNGSSVVDLTNVSSFLNPYQVDSIQLRVNIKPNGFDGLLLNQATFNGRTIYGNLNMSSSEQTKLVETSKTSTGVNIPAIGVKVPGGFSPNNDGIDDKWIITRPYGTTISVKVFNRWGAEIYSESNYQNTWDGRGTSSFMGEIVPEGTYFYIVEVTDVNGAKRRLTGALTIVK